MMDRRDAFRVGYYTKVAELGHTPATFRKLAEGGIAAEALRGVKSLGSYGLLLGLGVPMLGGIYTGKVHSMMNDVTPTDVEAMKRNELISEYKRQAKRITQRSEQRNWRKLFKRKQEAQKEEDLYA